MIINRLRHAYQSPWGQGPRGSNDQAKPLDDVIKEGQRKFNQFFKQNGGDAPKGGPLLPTTLLKIGGLIVLALWLGSGFYIVQEDEQGVILRFGAFVRTTGPGPNYHIPAPFETVIVQPVTRIQREEIGFRATGQSSYEQNPSNNARKMSRESLMLTGDENILDVNFVVQWKVKDLRDYLFNVDLPRETVRAAGESAMREVVGESTLQDVITNGRSRIEVATATLIQNILDGYETGIEVVSVQMLGVEPPTEDVISAFHDVQTAEQDKEQTLNNAKAYYNKLIPQAEGEAAKALQAAAGYKVSVVERAIGEASRFKAVYTEYSKAKDVTRRRMYLETLEQVLPGMSKMILDGKDSHVVPYLPLSELATAKKTPASKGE
jgi:membrane protease subunit HflK